MLVGTTVREAVSALGKMYVNCFGVSPFCQQGDLSEGLFLELKRQLKAMEKIVVGKKVQKAVTRHSYAALHFLPHIPSSTTQRTMQSTY